VSPGVTYSIKVERVDVNNDGTRSAVGIISRGYGQGQIEFPNRQSFLFLITVLNTWRKSMVSIL
jgi:hypothetical protein